MNNIAALSFLKRKSLVLPASRLRLGLGNVLIDFSAEG